MNRQALTLQVGGQPLMGTWHRPEGAPARRLGFLFLNPGPAPRSGNSDLSARLGDHLAGLGFHGFRFDLPGLGDSPGDVPPEAELFWREVQRGRNVAPTVDLARQLRNRFNLSGLVAGGMCAGAVTSVYAADQAPDAVTGLILLEPNFRSTSGVLVQSGPDASILERLRGRIDRGWMSGSLMAALAGSGPAARRIERLLPALVRFITFLAGPSRDLNRPLSLAWRRTLAARMPTLLLMAKGLAEDPYCRCLLADIPSADRKAVTSHRIPATNHIMTRGDARSIVLELVGQWAVRTQDSLRLPGERGWTEPLDPPGPSLGRILDFRRPPEQGTG